MNKQKCIKRFLALFMITAMLFSDFFGNWTYDVSAAKTVSVTKVKLNRTSATVTKGSTLYLKATVTPTNATNKKVKWTSSDKSVATVYSSGRVSAKKEGKTTIKATVGNKSAYCRVTVKNPVAVTNVRLNKTIMSITAGKTTTLKATVYPSNATNKKIKWSSNNVKVASVSSTGIVKAKRVGTAKITARSADGTKKATCVMTVKNPTVSVSSVRLNHQTANMEIYETLQLKATVLPSNATNKAVVWSSSDSNIVEVDSKTGEITAISPGTAIITVTTKSGYKKATCKIVVCEPQEETTTEQSMEEETSIEQSTEEISSETIEETTIQPSESVTTELTTEKNTTGETTSVEQVTTEGTTAGEKTTQQSTTQHQTTKQPATQQPTTQQQTTKQPTTEKQTEEQTTEAPTIMVTGISLNKKTLSLAKGGQEILKATVTPNNATNKEVQWTSSNKAVATVNAAGKVVAVGKGTATITAKTKDGGKTATCTVTVKIPVTGISITSKKEVALEYKENAQPTYQCSVKILPADAENQKVTWSSSNPKVATVDATGKITAVERGTATVTVTTADGAKTDTVNVYVYKNANQWLANEWCRFLPFTNTKLVMSVNTTSPKDGAKVVLSENGEASNQVWKFVKSASASGMAEITPKCGNGTYVLNATNNAMDVWTTAKKVSTSSWEVLKLWENQDAYFIRMSGTNKALAIDSANAKVGAQLVLKDFNPFDDTQKWLTSTTAPIAVTSVKLNKTGHSMDKTTTSTLKATVTPADATNTAVTWSSSNTKVATVDSTGKIKAVARGITEITVKTVDGGKTASIRVCVYDSKAEARGDVDAGWWLKLKSAKNQDYIMDIAGDTVKENVKVVLAKNSDTNAQLWKMTGKVGAWNIIPRGQTDNACKLAASTMADAAGLQLSKSTYINFEWIQLGDASNNNVYALKVKGTNWAVSAPANMSAGAQLVLKAFNSFDDSQKWVVEGVSCPTKVSFTSNTKNVALDIGKTLQCTVNVSPATAVNNKVTWSSSNTNIATVDATGKVTAVARGTAKITVKTVDGGMKSEFTVHVYESNAEARGGGNWWFQLKLAANEDLVMDVENGDAKNGAKVSLYKNTGSVAQLWQMYDKKSSHGGWAIVPKCYQDKHGFILDANGAVGTAKSLKAGDLVDLWNIGENNATSMFEWIRSWDGSYIIKMVNTNLVIAASSTTQGTQLVLKELDFFDKLQRWVVEGVYVVPVTPSEPTPDADLSEFNAKLEVFKNTIKEGSYIAPDNTYTVNGTVVGWQCFGFANLIAYNVMGSYPTVVSNATSVKSGWTITRASATNSCIDTIKVGDVVRYRSGTSWDHSIFITGISGDTIYYADCNGNGDNIVHYNRTISKATLSSKLMMQLVNDPNYYGWIAHKN